METRARQISGGGGGARSMAATGGSGGGDQDEFYLRYYVGHKGKFGHEFLEFEFRPDGKLRYANNSNYKNDTMIRKEVFVSPAVLRECRRIIADSEVRFVSSLSTSVPFFFVLGFPLCLEYDPMIFLL